MKSCASICKSAAAVQNPGVAKFGIALEWGSRGLEFESRHSDQKSRNSIYCFCFFLLCGEIRTIQCDCPVDSRLPPSSRRQLHYFLRRRKCKRIATLGPKDQNSRSCSGLFLLCGKIRTIQFTLARIDSIVLYLEISSRTAPVHIKNGSGNPEPFFIRIIPCWPSLPSWQP